MKHKLLTKLLTLVLLTLGGVINSAWADTATITFTSSSGSDSSTALTTSNFVSSGIESSDAAFGTISCSATTKCYNGKKGYGLKAGASSSAGSFTISFSTPITNVSKITLNRASYSDSKATYITVKHGNTKLANAVETPSGNTNFADMDITDLSIASLGSLTIETGKYCYIKSITVTYTGAPSHTLSSEVSPASTGAVLLGSTSVKEGSTTTITATPNDGYRFVNWTITGTGSTVESTTSTTTTFTMGTADAIVTANFEEIPTHTLSSSVSPVDAGTVTLDATSIMEGYTTTATASANAGYKFTGWSITGTGASLSSNSDNPTTITMGSADATVTASFEAVTTYAIKWSVNGTIVKTENVEENAAISFDDPTSGVPTGYTFKGWVTASNRIDGTTDTDPSANYVTSANSTEDITYYAVLAVGTPGTATWTLDYSKESSLSASTSWGAYGDAYEYTASDGGIWTVKAYKNSGMQINTGKNSSIKVPSCAGNIQSISITCSAAKAVGFSSGDYSGSGTITYLATGTDATSQTLDLSSNSAKVGYIVPKSGSTSITKIIVTYANTTYSHFCTAVSDVPAIVTADSYATFASELPLDFSSSSIKAYIAEVKGDKSGVTFTQVNKVPANTGVLLYKDGGESEYIPVLTTTVDDVTGNVFVKGTGATVATDDGDNYNYILNKVGDVVGFYRAAGKKVAANRAYISIPKAAPIKEFIALPDFEDDATSIQNSKFEIQNEEAPIYNLAGQRIQKLQKGINIVNGKKIMVK